MASQPFKSPSTSIKASPTREDQASSTPPFFPDPRQYAKVGYAGLMFERSFFNDDITQCSSPESAYLLNLEAKNLTAPLPQRFHPNNLQNDLSENDFDRIKSFFEKVKKYHLRLVQHIELMKNHYARAPKTDPDKRAKITLEKSPTKIAEKYKQAVLAMICDPEKQTSPTPPQQEEPSPLPKESTSLFKLFPFLQKLSPQFIAEKRAQRSQQKEYEQQLQSFREREKQIQQIARWQAQDLSNRRMFYTVLHDYMTSLMVYLQMLDEESSIEDPVPENSFPNNTKKYTTLPENHPLKSELKTRIVELRIIMAFHAVVSIGKTIINNLHRPNKLVRKTTPKATMYHAMEVVLAGIRNRLTMELDEDPANPIFLEGLHDCPEDSTLNAKEVAGYLRRLTDTYDSGFDQTISSGIPGKTRERFKRETLNLVTGESSQEIQAGLRILDNGAQLTKKEKDQLIELNPSKRIAPYNRMGIKNHRKRRHKQSPLCITTIDKYRTGYDEGKIEKFILRFLAIEASPLTKRDVLNTKILDRINNLRSLRGMRPNQRLKTLRASATQLISFIAADYPNLNYAHPLGNTPYDLIEAIRDAYNEMKIDHPEALNDIDENALAGLTNYEAELKKTSPKREYPQEYTETAKTWEKTNPT